MKKGEGTGGSWTMAPWAAPAANPDSLSSAPGIRTTARKERNKRIENRAGDSSSVANVLAWSAAWTAGLRAAVCTSAVVAHTHTHTQQGEAGGSEVQNQSRCGGAHL